MLRKILGTVSVTAVATAIASSPLPLLGAGPALAAGCNTLVRMSGGPPPNIRYQGDRQLQDPIEVQVCHGYWDELLEPRWWNVTIRFGSWEQDLDPVFVPCKTYYVLPGTDMRLYADCVSAIIGHR